MSKEKEESLEKVEKGLEKGEYLIGIAIILSALLLSATIYVSLLGVQDSLNKLTSNINKLKQAGDSAPTPQTGSQTGQTGSQTGQTGSQTAQTGTETSFPKIKIDLSNVYYKGSPNSKVKFVEYTDMQCPFCKNAYGTVSDISKNYDIQLYTKHFPLSSIHPNAQKAAEAAECAGEQGKFFEMKDAMFSNQQKLSVSDLKETAKKLGLNEQEFNSCLDSGKKASVVQAHYSEAVSLGFTGTPSFLVFSKEKSDSLKSKLSKNLKDLQIDYTLVEVDGAGYGVAFVGALPYSYFKQILDSFN